jgi:hypothetical protein
MIIPADQTNAGTYFYHYDGLGPVVALSNTSGGQTKGPRDFFLDYLSSSGERHMKILIRRQQI